MTDLPRMFEVLGARRSGNRSDTTAASRRAGFVDDAIGGADRVASLAALFPNVTFESLGPSWPDRTPAGLDLMIVSVDGSSAAELDRAIIRLNRSSRSTPVIVVLRHADVNNTRRLVHEGAADVLPAPVSEPALALSVERLLKRDSTPGPGKSGQLLAFLKAGGGVGATSMAAQLAAMLARRGGGAHQLCIADLDLQFGAVALYLDVQDAFSITDCLASGSALEESPFASMLAKHPSGASLLAAPRPFTPLEALTPELVSKLLSGLKRDFSLTMLDLPAVWTEWSNRALQLADRIVLVTRLSVPHIHHLRRQLDVLSMQRLDSRPLFLVCNAVTSEQQASLSIKAAERAIGRSFDFILPDDSRVMCAAGNQGQEIAAVKRGTKLERALTLVADAVAADAFAGAALRR